MSKTPYNQIDHYCCWTSKNPPCGQKIEHYKCCLCEKLNPKINSMNNTKQTNSLSVEEIVEGICSFDFEGKLWSDDGFDEFKRILKHAFTQHEQSIRENERNHPDYRAIADEAYERGRKDTCRAHRKGTVVIYVAVRDNEDQIEQIQHEETLEHIHSSSMDLFPALLERALQTIVIDGKIIKALTPPDNKKQTP